MTQTNIPAPPIAWCQALQAKLMAALDAAWAILEHSDDPAAIRRARDRAKACGELAAVARKVALIVPMARAAPAASPAMAGLASAEAAFAPLPELAPIAAQAEHARRALDKLKGGRRGRL